MKVTTLLWKALLAAFLTTFLGLIVVTALVYQDGSKNSGGFFACAMLGHFLAVCLEVSPWKKPVSPTLTGVGATTVFCLLYGFFLQENQQRSSMVLSLLSVLFCLGAVLLIAKVYSHHFASGSGSSLSREEVNVSSELKEPLLEEAEAGENRAEKGSSFRRLFQLVHQHRIYLYAGCVVLMVRLPFSLAIPHFVSSCLGAMTDLDFKRARLNVLYVMVAGSVDAVLDFWCVYLFGIAKENIVRSVRKQLFSAMLKMELAFFDTTKTGSCMSRLTADTTAMAEELTWFFRFSIEATIRIVGIAAYMFIRSPKLGGIACSIAPVVALVNKFYGDWLHGNAKRAQDALAEANSTANESLSCVRTVIALGGEDREIKRFFHRIDEYYSLRMLQQVASGLYYMLISTFLINAAVQAVLLYVGSLFVESKEMHVEVLLAFMLYQGQLQSYTLQIFQSFTALVKSSGAGDTVFEYLDREPKLPGTGSPLVSQVEKSVLPQTMSQLQSSYAISLEHVDFAYPSRAASMVLHGLSVEIPAAKTLALVGPSGCGKSTIVNLLLRFYDPSAGVVKVNGIDLKQIPLSTWRKSIGVVTQDPVLFSGSIMSNLLFGAEGDPAELEKQAIECAKLANAHDFISGFTDGYSTICGERGVALSGGQKQR